MVNEETGGSKLGEDLSIMTTGLTKYFGDVTAVNNISLNIRNGEIYGFLGLNGAGISRANSFSQSVLPVNIITTNIYIGF